MPNPHRGDVAFNLEGTTYPLRLTLGSLAMLETALGAKGLHELGQQFQRGHFSAHDVCHVLAAGFCGAGDQRTAAEVGSLIPASALLAATEAAAALLANTFGAVIGAEIGGGDASRPPPPQAP
jgi:hypothetical protein